MADRPMPTIDVSVVLPAHNEERVLGAQLDALIGQDTEFDWELVVVDNLSTDGTGALVERYAREHPHVRLVRAHERADKAYAVEEGVRRSTGPLLAFCDADDVVADGWLSAIRRGLAEHEVVTGPNELDRLNPPWLADSRGRSADGPVGSFSGMFPCIRGNNFGVRRETWISIGPLKPGFYPVEDIEFSFRCWRSGVEVVGLPEAVVHYRYRGEARTLWRQGKSYGFGRTKIARLLKDQGLPTPSPLAGWKSWAKLLVTLPSIWSSTGRAQLAWIAGNRYGQLTGSIRHRIVMI